MTRFVLILVSVFFLIPAIAMAEKPVQEQRHDLMEEMGSAAKKIGKMLKGEAPFQHDIAEEALRTMADIPEPFGLLFPQGSDSGYDTRAKSTIWSDREGFDTRLAEFYDNVEKAAAAKPQSLEELKAVTGPVFKSCKTCHEEYRVEES